MSTTTYDLIVIGAGPGGYVAAIRAAQLGMKVACIDKSALGGTCLNVGCIPSKALLESSHLYHETKHTSEIHGFTVGNVKLDLPAMMKRKDKIVKQMTGGVGQLFKARKVDHFSGTGTITSPTTVEVKGKKSETLETKRILIATGSVPVEIPSLPFDGESIVSSTEALKFESVPKSFVVIGAGAVGLEMGSVWSRLGSEVTVVEFMDTILPGMDKELTRSMQKVLTKQGLSFQLKSKAKSYEMKRKKVHLTLETPKGDETLVCDKVLVAVGRRANTESLGLDSVGIETDDRGRVEVNEHYETTVKGIFAIGDAIPGPMLAHKAEDEGIVAVERMNGIAGHVNYDAIPGVVYTHPELAGVGLTEEQCKERNLEVNIGKFPFIANGRAFCMNDTDGMVKIISDAKSDRILGMHILSGHASDLIAEGAIAIEFHSSAEDIARSVHAHPTLPEAIKEAALAVHKRPIHLGK